jgi:hypothetical protein
MATKGIAEVEVSAYDFPTAVRESDGTAEWDQITLVVVELSDGDKKGLGYTYADGLQGVPRGGGAGRRAGGRHSVRWRDRLLAQRDSDRLTRAAHVRSPCRTNARIIAMDVFSGGHGSASSPWILRLRGCVEAG